MFNEIYSIDLNGKTLKVHNANVSALAVKESILYTEVLLVTDKGDQRWFLADAPEAVRQLILGYK